MNGKKVRKRFTEPNLRAKYASDAETVEHARQFLSDLDSEIPNEPIAENRNLPGHYAISRMNSPTENYITRA
jgi:hypothetical protein